MAVAQSQPRTRLERRVVRFTGNGTWTVPAGVTHAVAHMLGGGGGGGISNEGGNGSNSSVAFSSGTVLSRGGGGGRHHRLTTNVGNAAGSANTGKGAMHGTAGSFRADLVAGGYAGSATYSTGGGTVTPGQNVTVVVGAGGTAGTAGAAGGSGYVWIEFDQPVSG